MGWPNIPDLVLALLVWILESTLLVALSVLPPVPGWVMQSFDLLNTVFSYAYVLDAWLPMNMAFTVAGVVVACFFAGVAIKIVRTVVSYLTFGGGVT